MDKFIMYGLFQYYRDELTSWKRTVVLYKEELGELVRKITVGQDQQISPEKESDNFISQFMEEEQKLDLIMSQITSQLQRLERSTSLLGIPIEASICQQQNLLRIRMHNIERNFIRTKYACIIFLSAFFNKQMLSLQRSKILKDIKFNYDRLSLQ